MRENQNISGTDGTAVITKGLVAIPARLASTRLPNKLILSETGKPLLTHVIERAQEAARLSGGLLMGVVVACEDEVLFEVAQECGAAAILTRKKHLCGTTRIAEAIERIEREGGRGKGEGGFFSASIDFVINVQADEPELAPEAILQVARELLSDPAAEMATLAIAMPADSQEMKDDPSAVKVVFDAQGRAMYFSRAPIPDDRNPPAPEEPLWYHHLGIYAYRTPFLLEFADLPPSALELREGLEQLRVLHAGKTIRVGTVPAAWAGKGIDTPSDYAAFVRRFAA